MNDKGEKGGKITICLIFPNWLQNLSFLKNNSELYLFGAVIFIDMVLPGLKFCNQRGKDI